MWGHRQNYEDSDRCWQRHPPLCGSFPYSHCHSFVSHIMLFRSLVHLFQICMIHHLTLLSLFFLSLLTLLLFISLFLCCNSGSVTSFNLVLSLRLFVHPKLQYPLCRAVLSRSGNASSQRLFFLFPHDSHVWSTVRHTVLGVGGRAWKTARQTQVGQILLGNISTPSVSYYLSWAYAVQS